MEEQIKESNFPTATLLVIGMGILAVADLVQTIKAIF